MTELKYKDYDLSDENLLRLLGDVRNQHSSYGNVAFAAFRLAAELEMRLLGVKSLQKKSDPGLFKCLSEGLTRKLEYWTVTGSTIRVDHKDQTYFIVGNGDDPCYHFKNGK